ncbi:MAG: hypothetical protein ABII00_10445 [Elusimicrobiota bacterium]
MDNKSTAILLVLFGLMTLGALGVLFVGLKPSGAGKPEGGSPVAASAPPTFQTKAAPAAHAPQAPSQQQSSLTFVQKSASFAGSSTGGDSSAEARKAAESGDAKSLVQQLKQDVQSVPERLTNAAIRVLMQKVVDTVHEMQPRWYNEFLGDRNLKAIADRYDGDKDFKAFLRLLNKSSAFHDMLRKRKNTPALRAVNKKLLGDETNGPKLEQLFFENGSDPNVVKMVRLYGRGSGLPDELLRYAGVDPSAPKKADRRTRRKRTLRAKPKLKPTKGFSGFGSSSDREESSKDSRQPQIPEGMDPALLQKYLKK